MLNLVSRDPGIAIRLSQLTGLGLDGADLSIKRGNYTMAWTQSLWRHISLLFTLAADLHQKLPKKS